ncbi:fructose-6-phosphate aldolase [Nitrospirillum sp. BR 11164]|uniref:fructose-6-phosphate aldolase n=1 Tax=Nitrospirillum sp. BR 11164 TaxID=3104324 RepID=UPI002B002BC2|nr:fructose-6-phosphate aldolase [Nitrospirillum sp. BR 11164]MEA1650136.1 fructose-6-phosphate aldolase [Nitrospirillum sp. BR 11164]
MKFFVDTADINDIRELASTGLLDGVTTNPSLVAKSGHSSFIDLIAEICDVVKGPVSAEVASTDFETMLKEGKHLSKIAPNVAVKVPLTPAGLKVCHHLSQEGTMVNVTLCFSAAQAILAAKAGATFVSPFVGRLDDMGQDGLSLIEEIVTIYDNYPDFTTEVLVASIRNPIHVTQSAKMGAHVATMPASVIRQLFNHVLTDKGLAQFVADWAKTGQTILDQPLPTR